MSLSATSTPPLNTFGDGDPFSEEVFPHIQSKPPLVQLEAISFRPITCYLGEETNISP